MRTGIYLLLAHRRAISVVPPGQQAIITEDGQYILAEVGSLIIME